MIVPDLAHDLNVVGGVPGRLDGHFAVEPGQWRTKTKMDSGTEAKGILRVAVDAVGVGVGPLGALIAVARAERSARQQPAVRCPPNLLGAFAVLTTAWLEFSNRSICSIDDCTSKGSSRPAVKMSG